LANFTSVELIQLKDISNGISFKRNEMKKSPTNVTHIEAQMEHSAKQKKKKQVPVI
jgi:hypothetical protein